MKLRSLILVPVLLLLSGCQASSPDAPSEPPLAQASDLDALVEQVADAGFAGIGLYVQRPGHAAYFETRGFANLESEAPLTPTHVFRIASVAKPYLATLMVKLAVEGRLSLDDRIDSHLPADLVALVPGASSITIYDLLTLWSGISDYRDLEFTRDVLFGDHSKVRDEYLDVVAGLSRNPEPCAPPKLPPEQITPAIADCLYSNTNYVLAGYIADKVLYGVEPAAGVRPATHHSRAFREQLFAPLGLASTFYEKHLAPGEHFNDRLANGYGTPPVEVGEPVKVDLTTWDDGNGYANGGIISTLDEVATFRRAIFDEKQSFPMATLGAKQQFLALLTRTNPLGLAPGGIAPGGTVTGDSWGFGGDIGGYTSWAEYSPTRDLSLTFYSNDRDFEEVKFAFRDAVLAVLGGS